jgi:hypothetical protein
MKRILTAGLVALLTGCSLLGESNEMPNAALSNAKLTAACDSKSNSATQIWMTCTVLSQATLVCNNVSSGAPVDQQLVQLIAAFAPDPVLAGVANASVDAANAALQSWCASEGYK